jgi:hypothetical protein
MKVARRLLPIVLIAAFTLALAAQAFAATPTTQAFGCLGKVTAVDPQAGTVTVTVTRASTALQGSLGQSLTLTLTKDSALAAIWHGVRVPVKLAGVPVGDLLAARGRIDATHPSTLVYALSRAAVWQPNPRARFICRGTVTSVDLQADTLAVRVAATSVGLRDLRGKTAVIDVPAGAKLYVMRGRLAAATTIDRLTAGDIVYATGSIDRSDAAVPVLTAHQVLATHVAPAYRLTWFSCVGTIGAVDAHAGTVDVTLGRATLAVKGKTGDTMTLKATARSVVRTLVAGVVTTENVAALSPGQSIVVVGAVDRAVPGAPVYDIGQAFVW